MNKKIFNSNYSNNSIANHICTCYRLKLGLSLFNLIILSIAVLKFGSIERALL